MTHQIRFADFELDLDLFQLKRSGCDVDLGPRALDLLACLISNRERVVSPERLRTEVWEGAALSASAIPTCVSELRRVLADDATQPRFIETVRSRGYRFIHPCESVLPDATRIGASEEGGLAQIQLPFVGREADLQILREAFRESLQGTREGVVLLRGEAGIGKTRLLSEFLRGLPVDAGQLMAPSSPIEGSPPFWPWTRLVRRATADSRMTSDELLARVGELAAVFPEIDERIHSPPRPPCEIDRFSILGLWAKTIRCLLTSRPLVLAFEDIHLLDVDSISLMSWLAEELREEPLLILATHRPPVEDGPSARRLAELGASPQAILRDLSPLTAAEIARLLGDPSEDRVALSRVLRRRSAGNPFYLTHLLRDLASHEERCRSGSPASLLPLHGSEIVTRQLSNLPTRTRRALEAASVVGVRFSIEAVAELAGTTEEETLVSLAPALRAMLVAQDELDYVFTHELLRDAIHGDLSPLARRELHLSMSRHLRARERPGSRTAEISDHLTAARPLGSAADVLEYAIRSAREAAARFAYSAAQSYFRRALKLLDDDPESAASARGGLLLEYARSRLYSGEREEARSTLLEAATLARSSGSSSLLAECALQLAPDFLSIEMGFYDATLVELIEEALDLVPEDEPALRAQLLARLCQAKQWATPASDIVLEELSEQALSAAERSGEPRAIYAALEARADSLHGPDRVDERLDTIQELTHRGGRGQGGPAVILQHIRHVAALLELGDMGTLDAAIDACDEAARELNLPQYLWYPLAFRASRALMQGELARADELGERFTTIGLQTGDRNVAASRACQAAVLALENDQAHRAVRICSDFIMRFPRVRAWSAGMALLCLYTRNRRRAMRILASFDEQGVRSLFRETGGSAGAAFLAQLAIAVSDGPLMKTLYELLAPVGDRGATLGLGTAYFGCFARYSGLLARALGLPGEANEHLRTAVALETQRGATLYRAHAQIDLALALVSSSGSAREARALIGSAAREAEASGLPRVQRRIGPALAALRKQAGEASRSGRAQGRD